MDKHFTIMVVPDRNDEIKSFRVPRLVFKGFLFLVALTMLLFAILSYDYWSILKQVYENKHLAIENRELKEQIQIFQMKLNSLDQDIDRIRIFEKKLRVITGFENAAPENTPLYEAQKKTTLNKSFQDKLKLKKSGVEKTNKKGFHEDSQTSLKAHETMSEENDPKFNNLINLYEQKIATYFGVRKGYFLAKNWTELMAQSFKLANDFARFDYRYDQIKEVSSDLELKVHKLDQFLLDRTSFLKATPTLLPVKGWITSYYGPRQSHYSGRVKMHEGIDIGAPVNTDVLAPADGIVTYSGEKPGFGWFVQINHGYGVETVFGHNNKNTIKRGEIIKRGQVIAKVGNTGYSTGPHVHYEIRVNGTPVDPLYYILD